MRWKTGMPVAALFRSAGENTPELWCYGLYVVCGGQFFNNATSVNMLRSFLTVLFVGFGIKNKAFV